MDWEEYRMRNLFNRYRRTLSPDQRLEIWKQAATPPGTIPSARRPTLERLNGAHALALSSRNSGVVFAVPI